MGWLEFLRKLRLADFKNNLKIEQGGIVNIKVENNYYNFQLSDSVALRKIQQVDITPELEERIMKEAENRLVSIEVTLNTISESSMKRLSYILVLQQQQS